MTVSSTMRYPPATVNNRRHAKSRSVCPDQGPWSMRVKRSWETLSNASAMAEHVVRLVKYSNAMRYIHSGSGIDAHLPSESLWLFLCGLPVTKIITVNQYPLNMGTRCPEIQHKVLAAGIRPGLQTTEDSAPERRQYYDQPRGPLPECQQQKIHQPQREVSRCTDGTRPHWMIERGQQQPDHGGIDAAQHHLEARLRAQEVPDRQAADKQQKGWQVNRPQGERRPDPAIGPGVQHRPQVRREGEQWTRDCLRGAVARDKLLVGDQPD